MPDLNHRPILDGTTLHTICGDCRHYQRSKPWSGDCHGAKPPLKTSPGMPCKLVPVKFEPRA